MTDLYIKNRLTGRIRRIGDDRHDQLSISNGRLSYYNLQNGEGCTLGENNGSIYEFVDNVDEYGYNCDPREE